MMTIQPWGKTNLPNGISHHLAHHCADVASVFEALSKIPAIRDRINACVGESLPLVILERLTVLAFLHDVGKLHPGFQAKGWATGSAAIPLRGHAHEGAAILLGEASDRISDAIRIDEIGGWGGGVLDLAFASISHHGSPLIYVNGGFGGRGWGGVHFSGLQYDPAEAAEELGGLLPIWFPNAFSASSVKLPNSVAFPHLFAGLVALADWIGSDSERFFPFVERLDPGYIHTARRQANLALPAIGIDTSALLSKLAEPPGFQRSTGLHLPPSAAQVLVGECSIEDQLVLLESETGSGKTEAAFWRFAKLFQQGRVSGLYFALPTRSAAIQIHGRIQRMIRSLFGEAGPEVVLAVPGYMKAGQATGQSLPNWKVLWDDAGRASSDILAARWSAESARRFLAAPIAVGTIDQAMLAGLAVKHAHLRRSALARSLLVIDEVHASDAYMTKIQTHLVRGHLACGGYAFLMSATLGSCARVKWFEASAPTAPPPFLEAAEIPYPALWTSTSLISKAIDGSCRNKDVSIRSIPDMAPEACAAAAIQAARGGAKTLVIRNTVSLAVKTLQAIVAAGASDLLLSVAGGPTLHHGRFAAADRKILDLAVEEALQPKRAAGRGTIVIGSQTLEQSLDIDADFLLTDLCPMDVLLQRIGRLHRHFDTGRPADFERPECRVLIPKDGLVSLLAPKFLNGLGGWLEKGSIVGIYSDLSILELTRRMIVDHPVWGIPRMNRFLVESCTHPDRVEELHTELGHDWSVYRSKIDGVQLAAGLQADLVRLNTNKPFSDCGFSGNEESIRTRLGQEGARIEFIIETIGPFGILIDGISLPAHWSRGMEEIDPVKPEIVDGRLLFSVGKTSFVYDRCGLSRIQQGGSV